ncbi:MAG: DivIVA domain-containing protein [Actinomycetota bacterium]
MKIEATTVEAHRFARVRRKGYDPIEVDRVIERLVATLRSHEQDAARLEGRVQEADDSVDAIRRTFSAAQRTRDEMINESAARAVEIVENAQSEAEKIVADGRVEVELVLFERDALLAQMHGERADLMADGEIELDRLRLEVEAARMSAVVERQSAMADLEEEIATLRDEALSEAERHANEMVGAARREEMRLTDRLQELRAAVDEVESAIHALSSLSEPRTAHIAEVIDLTAPESALAGLRRS